MLITDMTPGDTDAVNTLLGQLHDEFSGHLDPTKIRQAWKAWVCRDGSGAVAGFLLGSFIDYGIRDESAGTLELLVIDESVRGQGVGTSLVDTWKRWLRRGHRPCVHVRGHRRSCVL